jgi:nitroreductase
MDINEAIRLKRAVRKFSDQALSEDTIRLVLNAGRRSQSSKNTQPLQFIAIQDKTTLKALSELGDWAGHLAGAALGVVIVHPDPAERFQILFDVGQSAAYMQLAAWGQGVGSCLASIYHPDKARELLGFPEELHTRFAISFGYPAEEDKLEQPPQPGGRRPFQEVVHWERWNAGESG